MHRCQEKQKKIKIHQKLDLCHRNKRNKQKNRFPWRAWRAFVATTQGRSVRKSREWESYAKKLMIPSITCDHLLQRDFPHMSLSLMHNPPGDGNYNFCALCFCLNHCGIHRSPETVQEEIVKCLLSNPNNIEGFPLELFMGMLWSEYLQSLAKNRTC